MTGAEFLQALEAMHQVMLAELKAHIDIRTAGLLQLLLDIRIVQGADARLVDPHGERLTKLVVALENPYNFPETVGKTGENTNVGK
jgi:hypothetical protein